MYYFSDCQTGAASGCVSGNNANAGSVVASTVTGTSTMTVTFPTPVKGRYFRLTAKKTAGASMISERPRVEMA